MMEKRTVDIQKPPSDFKELLSLVSTGIEVILTKGNIPIARLLPVEPASAPRIAGLHKGAIGSREDFDAPLPEAFWTGEK